jgi:hypothetical protein
MSTCPAEYRPLPAAVSEPCVHPPLECLWEYIYTPLEWLWEEIISNVMGKNSGSGPTTAGRPRARPEPVEKPARSKVERDLVSETRETTNHNRTQAGPDNPEGGRRFTPAQPHLPQSEASSTRRKLLFADRPVDGERSGDGNHSYRPSPWISAEMPISVGHPSSRARFVEFGAALAFSLATVSPVPEDRSEGRQAGALALSDGDVGK